MGGSTTRVGARQFALASTLFMALAAIVTPARAAEPAAPTPQTVVSKSLQFKAERYALPNGLTVVLAPDPAATRVAIDVQIGAGQRDDPSDARGLTEIVGHLLSSPSTRHIPAWQRPALFRALGVAPWAARISTEIDSTSILSTVMPADVAIALWLEADRVGFVADGIDEAAIEQANRMYAASSPPMGDVSQIELLAEVEALGEDHALVRPPTPPGALRPSRVIAHAEKILVPRNIVLVVAGAFKPADVKRHIEATFGKLADRPKPERKPASAAPMKAERTVSSEILRGRPYVFSLWITSRYLEPNDLALDLAARIWMRRIALMTKDRPLGWAARQWSTDGMSTFGIFVDASEGQSADALIRIMDNEVARLRETPVTQEELQVARKTYLTSQLREIVGVDARAHLMGRMWLAKADPLYLFTTGFSGYEAITPERLREAVAAELPANKRVLVLPVDGTRKPGIQEARYVAP